MSIFSIPGGEIYYEEHGSGYPVLLFAPGFLSSRIERWKINPAKPGMAKDWLDPISALSGNFRVIALDVRNAGRSRAAIGSTDDWSTYTSDHLGLIDHLGITKTHVMGACIGVSFGLAMAKARPNLVSALVLQNPIGLASGNRDAINSEFNDWAAQLHGRTDIDPKILRIFQERMFGGDFIFSVSQAFVRECQIPMLLMPGDDLMHPSLISTELARAPKIEIISPWKGPKYRDGAMDRVRDFYMAHKATALNGG